MSYQATNLKKLKIAQITGSDLIIVTDITSSNELPETKTIKLQELKNYSTSSSNINSTFRTGSYGINFYGTLTGFSDTSSYSVTSSISNYTDYLIYPNSSTSSVSIRSDYANNSLNSDYSISASVSDYSGLSVSASNIVLQDTSIDTVNKSDKSLFSESSTTSSLSEKTRYIPFIKGIDNGTVYHSLHSDKSAYADVALEIDSSTTNVDGELVADGRQTIMTRSIKSLKSKHAISASNANEDIIAEYAKSADFADRDASGETFAYITFVISGDSTDITKLNVDPKVWRNINNIKVSAVETSFISGLEISIHYQDPIPPGYYATVKANVSPISNGYEVNKRISDNISDNLDYLVEKQLGHTSMVNCWGSSCSSTSGKISLYIKWLGSKKNTKWRKEPIYVSVGVGAVYVGAGLGGVVALAPIPIVMVAALVIGVLISLFTKKKKLTQPWGYSSVPVFLKNAIFSFVATISKTADSGSIDAQVPTTLNVKC